jgi:hypothetical protein
MFRKAPQGSPGAEAEGYGVFLGVMPFSSLVECTLHWDELRNTSCSPRSRRRAGTRLRPKTASHVPPGHRNCR